MMPEPPVVPLSVWIFKEALEKAGGADRAKVTEAIRAMDTTTGPARYFPGGRVKFEKNGRRAEAPWSSSSGKAASP